MYESFLEKLKRRMRQLQLGDALDKGIDIGAIVDPVQYENIDNWVKRGAADGAQVFQPECDSTNHGLLLSADALDQCRSGLGPGARRNIWSGSGSDELSNTERGRRIGEQHALWLGGIDLERKHQPGAGYRSQSQSGQRLDQ